MPDKIEVKTRFNADIIETSTMFHNGLRYDDIAVKVIKLQEQGVIEALKHLGWTPPSDQPKIKMTKTLPSEVGRYFWSDNIFYADIKICSVYSNKYYADKINKPDCDDLFVVSAGLLNPQKCIDIGGYWAKVEPYQFEFED